MELRTTFALAQSERSHAVMRAAAGRRQTIHPPLPGRGEDEQAWKEHLVSMKTVTIDTNVLPASSLVDLARNKGYEVAIVSVTEREVGQFDTRLHVQDLGTILETGLWGESVWGKFLWGNTTYLESILKIISNGSFPKPGQRGQQLSEGQRRQLRDAMILNAHPREGRGIFVTDDKRGFLENGRREKLQSLLKTRILTREEFLQELHI